MAVAKTSPTNQAAFCLVVEAKDLNHCCNILMYFLQVAFDYGSFVLVGNNLILGHVTGEQRQSHGIIPNCHE